MYLYAHIFNQGCILNLGRDCVHIYKYIAVCKLAAMDLGHSLEIASWKGLQHHRIGNVSESSKHSAFVI